MNNVVKAAFVEGIYVASNAIATGVIPHNLTNDKTLLELLNRALLITKVEEAISILEDAYAKCIELNPPYGEYDEHVSLTVIWSIASTRLLTMDAYPTEDEHVLLLVGLVKHLM